MMHKLRDVMGKRDNRYEFRSLGAVPKPSRCDS